MAQLKDGYWMRHSCITVIIFPHVFVGVTGGTAKGGLLYAAFLCH